MLTLASVSIKITGKEFIADELGCNLLEVEVGERLLSLALPQLMKNKTFTKINILIKNLKQDIFM
tara:strand:+ start:42 stop:236 length:195 start_codon:yes stop_codon:yes gene_type:complete